MPPYYKGAGTARDRPSRSLDRGMAGDRPPPYDVWRRASLTVARGPVPRDPPIKQTRRRTGPRPTVLGDAPH